jgi:hypothetical protein
MVRADNVLKTATIDKLQAQLIQTSSGLVLNEAKREAPREREAVLATKLRVTAARMELKREAFISQEAQHWLTNATQGHCGMSWGGVDARCSTHHKGSFQLSAQNTSSRGAAVTACIERCRQCRNCRWLRLINSALAAWCIHDRQATRS